MASDLTVIGLGCAGTPLTVEASRDGLVVQSSDNSPVVAEALDPATSHGNDIVDNDVVDKDAVGLRPS